MNDLTVYRLKKAEETLNESRILLEARLFKGSVSRSYYSIFSSVRALLAERGVDFSKHAGVISYFQKEYMKTRLLDVKYSDYIQNAFLIRNKSDYDDFYIVSHENAEEQYQHAVEFLDAVKRFLGEEQIN